MWGTLCPQNWQFCCGNFFYLFVSREHFVFQCDPVLYFFSISLVALRIEDDIGVIDMRVRDPVLPELVADKGAEHFNENVIYGMLVADIRNST